MFFMAVDLMNAHLHVQREIDMTKPGVPIYELNWKAHQNSVFWVNLKLAQRKELTFYQTRSNAIILHDTLHHSVLKRWFLNEVRRNIVRQSV